MSNTFDMVPFCMYKCFITMFVKHKQKTLYLFLYSYLIKIINFASETLVQKPNHLYNNV